MHVIANIAKWILPRLVPGLKAAGKFVSTTATKGMNFALPKMQSIINKTGSRMASTVSKPVVSKAILKATEILAKEKVLKPIIKDLAFKTVKTGVSRIPIVGKSAKKVADFADAFIGIPFI